jgi:Winged helix DNA-binding domain
VTVTDHRFASQLLDRAVTDPVDAITRLIGVYSTALTSHLALIARLDGYKPADLDKGLLEERSIVRLGAMRGSGYFIPTELVPVVVGATSMRRERIFRDIVGKLMDRRTYESLAKKVEKVVEGREITTADIRKEVGDERFGEHFRYVVQLMSTECRLIVTRTSGTWRSNRTFNALWSDWLPDVDPFAMDEDTARTRLAEMYFAAHGPATVEDFAWWSGLGKEAASKAADIEMPKQSGASTPKGVRLLPIWDGLFLTYKDRSPVIPDGFYDHVYDRSGNPTSVLLVDGVAAGQWDLTIERGNHEVKVAPFRTFTAGTWKLIDAEIERLATALDASDMKVVRLKKAPAIDDKWNRFMSPLKDA